MEFGSIEEGRDEDAKRRRIHHVVGFGDVEEYVAAQRVEKAYKRLHGLCVIQREIFDILAPMFHEDIAISELYRRIFTIARDFLEFFISMQRIIPLSTDPLFNRHQRLQCALQLLGMEDSLRTSAIEYDSNVWPFLHGIAPDRRAIVPGLRRVLGPARTLLLQRETSGMQEDVREYVEALEEYVKSMQNE